MLLSGILVLVAVIVEIVMVVKSKKSKNIEEIKQKNSVGFKEFPNWKFLFCIKYCQVGNTTKITI